MNERDRVLDAFRNCITEPKCRDCPWTECSTLDNGSVEIPRDLALAVMRELAAQEPRVLAGAELTDAELIEKIRKAPITLKPAVDAVPVEWMRDKMRGYASALKSTELKALVTVMQMWQKEQEER